MSNHYNPTHSFENAGEVMKMVSSPPEKPQQPNVIQTNFPLIGRLHIVKDKKGMLQIGFVFFYWIYGTFTSLFIVILPGHDDGHISGVFIGVFMTISFLCLTSLIRASTLNPGRIPPESDEPLMSEQKWTFCRQCNRKRPHRAHHCRRCGQCVMRMDHHCPWINNCVGEENHWAFFLLLLYAFLLSAMSFILCMLHFWVYPKCQHCDRDAFYMKHSIWFMYLLTLLAFNMAFMMAVQLVGQHFNLVIDRTTLENMQNPPDAATMFFRSMFSAYEDLCGSSRNKMLLWFLPCRKRFHSLPKYSGSNIV